MTFKTLADPVFHSIINKGEITMNYESNAIDCQTGEERPLTTLINPSSQMGQPVPNQPIQGISGATYAPMDTSPQAQQPTSSTRIDQLLLVLATTLEEIIGEMNAKSSLEEAVETTLSQANWFYDMVKEAIDEQHDIDGLVNDRVDDRIGAATDEWFSYNFSLEDHCDLNDIVADVLDDRLESLVEEKLEQLLAEKLRNANITVNF